MALLELDQNSMFKPNEAEFGKLFFGFNSDGFLEVWTRNGDIILERDATSYIKPTQVCRTLENQNFYAKHGVTPRVVAKSFNRYIALNVLPTIPEVFKYGVRFYGRKVFTGGLSSKAHLEDILKQCRKDGISHISPIVFETEKTPEQLKCILGRGLWKKITKNSESRNKLIAIHTDKDETENGEKTLKTRLAISASLPSSLLKYGASPRWFGSEINGFDLFCKKNNIKYSTFKCHLYSDDTHRFGITHKYCDTQRMAQSLGMPFGSNWSLSKLNSKHDEYSLIIRRQEIDKLKHIDFRDFHNLPDLSVDGAIATPIINPVGIKEEAISMDHCVDSYVDLCVERRYVVYSIQGTKGEKSTLGICINDAHKFILHQHFGKSNSPVKDKSSIHIANIVIKELNKFNRVNN